MFFLIYILFFTLTYGHKCSFKNSTKYQHTYLCQEKLNTTSIRIWLHMKFNKSEHEQNFFLYYTFTLRVIDLTQKHKTHLKDHFEKQISDYVKINFNEKENNTINIHNLPPGRYEICVNFLNNKTKNFYYRSSTSCLYVSWNVPEYEHNQAHLMQMLLIISIIILLAAIVFFIYALHQYFAPEILPVVVDHMDEKDEVSDNSERAKLLIHKHFVQDVNPFASSVRKRIHQRYAHRSPDPNDT
ncbi:unnamed protein product [Rotaria sordida]|uniref:Uncharacterized protein n=1 Tax=Rotaria sordida TaxID=392033 RepID=A0A813YJ86_9BILA|nr:unnamed protein product [Rotaria sordida]CAF0923026.1 unnamed protein product [Rotaria sordida]CAF0941393.1 unnamed protein product [Rotaria sordida]CAF3609400.1 unnamed protein product [Rotaria sordida]CAF3651594.1 unnamed protein product [Rotaria sordida]